MKHAIGLYNPENGKATVLHVRATTVEELYLIVKGLEDLGLDVVSVVGDLA